jgi:hypothetical protein
VQEETAFLKDVADRLAALAKLRRLRPQAEATQAQLVFLEQRVAAVGFGAPGAETTLREAADANRRLQQLMAEIARAEQVIRQTDYCVRELLDEGGGSVGVRE